MATTSNQVKIHIDNEEIILIGEALATFEADRAAIAAQQLAEKQAAEAAEAAKATAAASAVAKLEAIGLTADEIAALRG